jgi:hypothetical protein
MFRENLLPTPIQGLEKEDLRTLPYFVPGTFSVFPRLVGNDTPQFTRSLPTSRLHPYVGSIMRNSPSDWGFGLVVIRAVLSLTLSGLYWHPYFYDWLARIPDERFAKKLNIRSSGQFQSGPK